MLTPFIPYDPFETVGSYAARLARIHTGIAAERLLQDFDVNAVRFRAGDPDAISRLADATGETSELLQAGTIRTLNRHNSFRNDDYSKTFLSPRVRQFCPHCIIEDGDIAEWRHRLAWCVWSLPVCPKHHAVLVEVAGDDIDDVRHAVDRNGGLEMCLATSSNAAPGPHTLWVHDRLARMATSEWLDGQTIEQVTAASEMLGLVLVHGLRARPARMSRRLRCAALEAGFAIYREGPESVYAAMTEIRHRSSATAVQAGPLAMYGILYDWLDRRSKLIAPGPIKNILRAHILDHDAYGTGEALLGDPVEERRLHSVKSLAQALRLDRRRMSRLLQKLGLVPDGATDAESGRLAFPVNAVEQLVVDYQSAVPLAEISGYLGSTQSQALALYRTGVLQPMIPADVPGSVRRVLFSRRTLDDILAKIDAVPIFKERDNVDALSVGDACQCYGGVSADLIGAILAGRLRAFRIPGAPRLHALRILRADVAPFSAKPEKVPERT